jgi:hypothetical protein
VTSQTSKELDMTFVPTKDGMNPKGEGDAYQGKSLLRYSNEEQEINKDIPDMKHMKKLPVGKVKYKGKIASPPETDDVVEVLSKPRPKKKHADKAEVGNKMCCLHVSAD